MIAINLVPLFWGFWSPNFGDLGNQNWRKKEKDLPKVTKCEEMASLQRELSNAQKSGSAFHIRKAKRAIATHKSKCPYCKQMGYK